MFDLFNNLPPNIWKNFSVIFLGESVGRIINPPIARFGTAEWQVE
jgi:hypothetical protein